MSAQVAASPFAGQRNDGQRIAGWVAIALILLVVVLGGGGSSSRPAFDAICLFAGFLLLGTLVAFGPGRPVDAAAKPWLVLAMLAFLLPLSHLLPLPEVVSSLFSGRELADAIRAEAGANGPVPLSLDPDRTLLAALSLIPGIALFAATLRCNDLWRRRLVRAWIGVGVLAVLAGALQVATSGDAMQLYETSHRTAAIGFFANRNHQSIFLVTILLLLLALLATDTGTRPRAAVLIWAGLIILLVAGVFITRSRAGIFMLVLVVPLQAALLWRGRFAWRLRWPFVAFAGAAVGGLAWFVSANQVARAIIARFSFVDDGRLEYWPDVVHTVDQFWPSGSGIGTFQAVFATQERLGTVDERYLNHAHNDYLEFAIEGGIVAVALIIVFAILFAMRIVNVPKLTASAKPWAVTGAIAMAAILFHSLIDYPLRATTVSTLFGFLAGLLFPSADSSSQAGRN